MFYSVFSALLSLVTLLGVNNTNEQDFANINRFNGDTLVSNFEFTKSANTLSYYYDNSSIPVSIAPISIGGYKDSCSIYSNVTSDSATSIAKFEWYYTYDNSGNFYLNFNTYNFNKENFNLDVDVTFNTLLVDNNNVVVNNWLNCFSINFATNEYRLDTNYVDESHQYFDYQAIYYGHAFVRVTFSYSPMEEAVFNSSTNESYNNGYNTGYEDGYDYGYDTGLAGGYQSGYTDGYNEAVNQDSTAALIFTGILEVGLLPINVFLAIFNFEVFGINISGLVASLLTVAVIVIIIRVILSKSGGGSKE